MHPSAVAPLPTPRSVRAARNEVTLLLVDDDPIVSELLLTVLTLAGYTVITAPGGQSALDLAVTSGVDMLITDFQMPGMDGCTLAKRVTELWPALPVLLISGTDPADLPLEDFSYRRWKYLPKPVDRARMLSIIDQECLGRVGCHPASAHIQTHLSPAARPPDGHSPNPPPVRHGETTSLKSILRHRHP